MKKKVLIFLMTFCMFFLGAYEYKGISNINLERTPWQIIDGNVETYWSVKQGEQCGWLEIICNQPEKKEAVYIDCEIPEEAEIQLYEKNGNGQTSLSGCFKVGPFEGETKLCLPKMRRETSIIGIKLAGKNASEIKIKEVSCESRNEIEWGKIVPVSYEFNLSEQINIKPSRLWDSKISGPWYEPLWYLPYEIQKNKDENRVEEIFGKILGVPNENAEIIWELDGKYKIEIIKTYIQRAFRAIKVEYEEDGLWKVIREIGPYNQKDNSWCREDVEDVITDRIRITFPGGWEQARFISEIEIWGERLSGEEKGNCNWKEIYGVNDETFTHYIENCENNDLEVEISIPKTEIIPNLYINSNKIDDFYIYDLNDNVVVRYFIRKEYLRKGYQFIKIGSSNVKSCLIRNYINKGIVKEGLEELYSNEKIIEKKQDGQLVEQYLCGIKGTPEISEDTISKIVYGSPCEDFECDLELFRPLEEDCEWTGSIIGWTGNSLDNVIINGYGLSRSDRLFYLPLEQMDFNKVCGQLKVHDKNNKSEYNFTYFVKGGEQQKGGILKCKEVLEYVNDTSYFISGIMNNVDGRVYVNGKEIFADKYGNFSSDVLLSNGYQRIEIVVKENSEITAYWTKEVYKITDNINIYLSGAESGILTQDSEYTIEGNVWNTIDPRLYINGQQEELKDGVFSYKCNLNEGSNEYNICVKDSLGRSIEKKVFIEKDTTIPDFKIIYPENNIYNKDSFLILKVESEEAGLWYAINNGELEFCEEKKYARQFELEDGFYDWTICAYDAAGNKSDEKSIKFCIDTELPESFSIKPDCVSDINNWRNTNNVTLSFDTKDETSGIQRYEFILDNGDWRECVSPLDLGMISDGIHHVFVRAIDNAENIRLETLDIYVDVTNPKDFDFTANISKKEWSNSNSIILNFNAEDVSSGIKKYTLSIDGDGDIEVFNGELSPVIPDGKHILTISAHDYAGNVTKSSAEYYIDVTSPLEFEGKFNIKGWSNQNCPVVEFSSTDLTSGIYKYELKLNDNDWKVVNSPYKFDPLEDGINNVIIRAIDYAGNQIETCLYKLYIDTTKPLPVENCRLIPGNGNMEGKWDSEDDDIIAYHLRWFVDGVENYIKIEGESIWENGLFKEIKRPKSSYLEKIANGKKVRMIVQPEDKAHNLGEEKESHIAMTGVSIVPLDEDKPTAIEYEKIKMAVPPQGKDSNIKGVIIKEVNAPILHENSVNPILSPIYSFTTLVDNGSGNLVEQEHTNFEQEVVFFLSYDETMVPNGFPESDLEVYYYDDLWGRWFRAEKSGIDIEQNIIFVATNHFTKYAIQPTLMEDLSPEELKKAGRAYGNTESSIGDITISPESGTMLTEATEFIIHGKNGFEFPIKRIYDTQTARLDGPSMRTNLTLAFNINAAIGKNILEQLKGYGNSLAESTVKQCFQNYFIRNGDYNLALGAGWRLNLPYIMVDNNNVMVRLPNGSYYSTNKMDVKFSDNIFGLYHDLVLENHIGDDFTLSVKLRKSLYSDVETSLGAGDIMNIGKELADVYSATSSKNSVQGYIDIAKTEIGWIIEEATLTMKDGMQYVFSSLGYIDEIRDPSKSNIIKFNYKGRLLESITDPYENEIKFSYNMGSFLRPYITSIEKKDAYGNISKWNYNYDFAIYENLLGILPQLSTVTDGMNRVTTYQVDKSELNILLSGGGSAKVNVALAIMDIWPPVSAVKDILGVHTITLSGRFGIEWPQFINKIEAPEKGTVNIEYTIQDLSSMNVKPADYLIGLIPTAAKFNFDFLQKLFTQSVTQENGNILKKTTYEYTVDGFGSQHLVTKCIINDGNIKTENNYNVYYKESYRYTCIDDNVLEILSNPTLMTEESNWEKSYYTKFVSSTIKKVTGDEYESKKYTWDNSNSRLVKEVLTRGPFVSEKSYEYDNWGNITKQIETVNNLYEPTRGRIKTTINQYFGTNSSSIEGFPYDGVLSTEDQIISGFKNLLIAQSENDGYLTIYKANAYDRFGQNIWTGLYNDNHWSITKTEYKDGEISKQINPLGLEMEYTYENKNSQIIKTIEYKDKNILIKSAKSIYTSDLLWESDGNGNTTKYSYDKLGRITKKEYPEGKIDYIVYDDKCKTITIKNEDNNAYKKYYYDDKKNLIQQDLYDYSSGEPVISTVLLSYDKNDNVVAMTDPNNNTTRYSYDVLDRLVLQTNADSTKKTVDYDDNLSIRTVCDENGNIVMENLAYDGLVDRQEKQNTNETQVTSYTYDAKGRVVKMQDSLGQIISTEYSVFGEVSKITRPKVVIYENNEVSPLEIIEYNDLGLQIIKKVGYENNYRVEEITYDSLGRKESVCRYAIVNGEKDSEERVVSYTYDANGNVLTETDEEGNVKFYTYTARNQKKTETDAMGAVISYEYDRNDKMIKVTDAMGFVAEYTYDDLQRLVKATLPALAGENREVKIVYDKVGNTLSMLEPDGKNTVWEYDNRNRKISETITGTNADAISKVWTYDNLKNIKTLREGNLVTTYIYDKVYNLVETNFPDGQRLIKQYDKLNRVTNEQNANGSEKVFEYNSLNQITKQRDEEYTPTEFKYDVWGNLVWRKEYNPNGNGDQIWNITYNNFNEPIEEIKNDGTNWKYEYNKKGLLTKKIEPNGTILLNLYDSCDRIVQEKRMGDGKTEIKSYNYDANGFMNQAADNGVTSLINYKNGEYKANAYNLTTSHTTTISGKSVMTEYEYDQGLRISAIKYPDERSVRYEYNGLGQLTGIQNADGEKYATKGTYDSLGRLVSLTAGNGTETSYTWDNEKGVLSGYSWGFSEYISRELTWDNEGNIVSILKGSFDNPYTNIYEYDKLGRLLHEKNGAKVEVTSKNIDKTRYLYVENDVSGKKQGKYTEEIIHLDYYAGSIVIDLEEIQTVTTMKVFGKNERISSNHFEVWISEDNINWQKENIRWENDISGWKLIFPDNTKARYVKLHSLWDERDENYNAINKSTYKGNIWNLFEVNYIVNGKENVWRYDSRGNRLTEVEMYSTTSISKKEYEYYENSDLIKKAGNWYFNYDNNGNLLSRGNVAQYSNTDTFCSWDFAQKEGELWVYEYDLQNRLIKTSYSGKGKTNLKERASYTYDYKGLLVRKSYQDYDKSNYIELDKPTSSKEITEYYEYTLDGRVIYNERKDNSIVNKTDYIWANTTLWCEINEGVLYYHHTDHLGTTEVITDSNGNIVWHADYEAFGSVMNERGEENFTPNYTGKFFDESSGLYYFNARWYDSALGRFTTQDPARDGVNWWAYCGGNPITFVDPDGRAQNAAQKILTAGLKNISNNSQIARTFIKEHTSIQIQRSADDNGQNGKYFKSKKSVSFCGILLNTIDVQSTADYKTEVDAGRGRTIDAGTYTGTLLNKSGSYNEAISITGNGVVESEAILCHPNAKTAKGATEEYANGERPYSAGCQILHLEDFNEVTGILKDLGFEYGKGNDAWTKGDTIKINIKSPEKE